MPQRPHHYRERQKMAKIVELEPGISIASQLVEADFALLASQGFRSVVSNRPDGEAEDQLPHRDAELAARRTIEGTQRCALDPLTVFEAERVNRAGTVLTPRLADQRVTVQPAHGITEYRIRL